MTNAEAKEIIQKWRDTPGAVELEDREVDWILKGQSTVHTNETGNWVKTFINDPRVLEAFLVLKRNWADIDTNVNDGKISREELDNWKV